MAELIELLQRPLTPGEYQGVLGQEYCLVQSVAGSLTAAAGRVVDAKLADFLRQQARYAADEARLAQADLADLGADASVPPTPATSSLSQRMQEVAHGDEAHRVLALAVVRADVAPNMHVDRLAPVQVGAARRLLVARAKAAARDGRMLDDLLTAMPPQQRDQVLQQADELTDQLTDFLIAAAHFGAQQVSAAA